jgi:hypothetical protein
MRMKTLVLFFTVTLTACSSESTKLKGEFLAGCIQSGGNKEICLCVFEDLQEKYGFESTKELEMVVIKSPDFYMQDMGNSALMCRTN